MSNLLKKSVLVALLVFTFVLFMVPYTNARKVEELLVEETEISTKDEEIGKSYEVVRMYEVTFDPGSGSGFMSGELVESGEEYYRA